MVGERIPKRFLSSDDNVVDGNVNEFDEKADEPHDGEPNGRRQSDLGKLLAVGFRTSLD